MKKFKEKYLLACQKIGTAFVAPTEVQGRIALLAVGAALITLGTSDVAFAGSGNTIAIQDEKVEGMVKAIIEFIEGSFGALIMVIAGIGAIVSAAFGQYRAALGMLAVAIGAFILRSLVKTFFPNVIT